MSALQLGRIWASAPTSPNIDPGSDKWKLGWVPEIPVFQMLNFINNRYDTNIVALAERGQFEWGSDLSYNLAAMVWDETDGGIYLSKVASPLTTIRPSLNLTQWDKSCIQISRAQYDAAVASWANHIANTSNPHQLTTDILNTYSKAVIDQKVAVVQSSLTSHINNIANVHQVTATQAGAVPVAGGSYTGLVRHLYASTGIGDSSFAAKLMTDATGTFLALGTNPKLGIDSTKKAVFVDGSGVKSSLLLDANYISAREAVEASYVPPTPDCEINFRNSLSMLAGAGAVTFLGPAGSRGYTDKSGTAQTAALNTARFTASGLYTSSNIDNEDLQIPTSLNILNSPSYTWCIDVRAASFVGTLCALLHGSIYSSLTLDGTNFVYQSASSAGNTAYVICALEVTKSHKFTVASDATANKTSVYFDGVLMLTLPNKQSVVTGPNILVSYSAAAWGAKFLNGFRTWLTALTPQQVSNL